jgi:hypothetical protein
MVFFLVELVGKRGNTELKTHHIQSAERLQDIANDALERGFLPRDNQEVPISSV